MASYDYSPTQHDDAKNPFSTATVEIPTPISPDRAEDLNQKKLILCFDGTTNSFQGNDSDTNVVKLFEMFDRVDRVQYHYYQPGIGTYVADTSIKNVQTTNISNVIKKKKDEMYASSFADHVIAGYKFLMRYYMEGDQVYIFGFSRGAYTARFLTEFIDHVGLLSKGNEENLPFLWYHYSDYRRDSNDKAKASIVHEMSQVFCRKQEPTPDGRPVKFVYFLGLWDCVNSVRSFSQMGELDHALASPNIALHIRHAISCHERRVMFKPTLFLNGDLTIGTCEERWFAGNHGDVGGGWAPTENMLLSDIPLIWMVEELKAQEKVDLASTNVQPPINLPISWRNLQRSHPEYKRTFAYRKEVLERNMAKIRNGHVSRHTLGLLRHDPLSLKACGKGFSAKLMCLLWRFMEYLPLAHPNLELRRSKDWQRLPNGEMIKRSYYQAHINNKMNHGAPRRIPLEGFGGKIHPSVQELYHAGIVPSLSRETDTYRFFEPIAGR